MPQGKQSKDIRMERVLEVWLNNPFATFKEIADEAGVSVPAFQRYRKDEAFMEEYHKRQKSRFSALEGKAIAQLENKLDDGEWKAIQYTLDGLGYKATEKVEANTNNIITLTIGEDEE